jgi:predicted lysophospholipase L1 biosynthesis ABC-type transport system permease subunit
MRTAGLAAVGAGVQGMFLYRAIVEVPSVSSWVVWALIVAVLLVGFTYAGLRDRRLNTAEAAERDRQMEAEARQRREARDRERARRTDGEASH